VTRKVDKSQYICFGKMYRQPAKHLVKIFVTVQKHFTADCRCREAVKLLWFPLSPYRLGRTYNNVQNCAFRSSAEIGAGGA
jgi:hypothetical protein